MKRIKINIDTDQMPEELRYLFKGAEIYDSSCSPEARVFFIDRDGGYFLKTAPKGALEREAVMDRYFYKKGLGARVAEYLCLEGRDWLLTERVPGEDATHSLYTEDPKRLAERSAEILRELHGLDFSDCPVKDRISEYFQTVRENYEKGQTDLSFGNFSSAEEAYRTAIEGRSLLKGDTLIHGDYCLPNFLMDNWRFKGFIDLGNGGVGDRHIDIFWGVWTLRYNLKTDAYGDRFLDAYGREKINKDALRAVSACECFG